MRVFIKRVPATMAKRGVPPDAVPCIVCEAIEFKGARKGYLPQAVNRRAMKLADDYYKDVGVFVVDPATAKFKRRTIVASVTKH